MTDRRRPILSQAPRTVATMTAMNDHTPDRFPLRFDTAAIEDWFADAGLAATVVDRCPEASTCPICRRALSEAA
jgi:hypothetical protein